MARRGNDRKKEQQRKQKQQQKQKRNYSRFFGEQLAEKKIRRIYHSSGSAAAAEWAAKYGWMSIFRRVEAEKLASKAHLLQMPLVRTRKPKTVSVPITTIAAPNPLDQLAERLRAERANSEN
ncbi:MAG: hypothetical protein HYT03_02850 [Candidatus Harrisonbacteria bacterium]|nr:hypothetical protein [Candidatus Harrisonbacteria bacterium]